MASHSGCVRCAEGRKKEIGGVSCRSGLCEKTAWNEVRECVGNNQPLRVVLISTSVNAMASSGREKKRSPSPQGENLTTVANHNYVSDGFLWCERDALEPLIS